MGNFLKRILRIDNKVSVGQTLADRIVDSAVNWVATAFTLGSGGVMAYLASITAWLVIWGPVTWGAIAIVSALLIGSFISLFSLAKSKRIANYARSELDHAMAANRDVINPLANNFNKMTINLKDMFIPYSPLLEEKTFIDCDIIGPGVIILNGISDLSKSKMIACAFISYNESRPIRINGGAIGLKSARFRECRIVNVTFLLPSGILHTMIGSGLEGFSHQDIIGYEPPQ